MIVTPRLLLRPWQDSDLAPFAAMNADSEVRRYFPGTQTRAESDASVERYREHFAEHGFTFFATELRETGVFVGFVGLIVPGEGKPFPENSLEAGWRLAKNYWGHGLATEAARACVQYGLNDLGAAHVGAITTVANEPSINVMRKVGMVHVASFMHPDIDPASPIAPHVLYLRAVTTAP